VRRRVVDRSVLVLASLALLNASLTFVNVWPTPRIRWDWSLSVELAVLVLLLALARSHAASLARTIVPAAWLVLVMGRYADVTGPGLYGRDVNLYWDAAHLGNVAAMLGEAVPGWLLVLGTLAVAVAIGVAFVAARAAWTSVAGGLARPKLRPALIGAAAVLVCLYAAQALSAFSWPHAVPFASPVSRAYARQVRYVLAMSPRLRGTPGPGDSPSMEGPFRGLGGADVVLVFVEAYGTVTFDVPRVADTLVGPRDVLAAAVRDAGRAAVSARIASPTFGASSWLAHLTLLTGVEVRDQYAYVGVMASTRDTLPRAFRRAGYRSVAVMPGLRQAWPEGAFYGFDRIYGRDALQYRGPRFGWWGIPDQYTLARLDALELTGDGREPRFVVFPTSTTHAPFGPVPPYQPDWTKVLAPDGFDAGAIERALAERPDLTNLSPSYVRAVAYALTTFAGYVREHAGDRSVLILIGDHQPVAAVTGPGASYDVPMHVIAAPGPIVDRLRAAGFVDGLQPPPHTLTAMHALVPVLVEAFH
jgi:hypothetical protein